LFGASSYATTTAAKPVTERVSTGPAIRTLPPPRRNWLLPLGIAAIALLGYSLARGFRRPTAEHAATPNVTQTAPRAEVARPTAPQAPAVPAARMPVTLPNGQTLSLVQGSGLAGLAAFLGGAETAVPRQFNLTPMAFQDESANIAPESLSTVNDLASVLKAYPTASVTIASFTDNVGSPDTNLALSTSRSEAIQRLLAARGVDSSRVNAVGFGADHPIAPNDTAEGRLRNNRSEVIVTNK
jgi:outer membrane protein OmpA-like peptidoglycan-associated protein